MRFILFVISSVFIVKAANSQTLFTKEFWLNESNISIKVNDLAYEDNGYIWLASDNGLYRFNGRTFTQISDSIHQPVTALVIAQGTIYAGYKNGKIGVVKNNQVQTLMLLNRFPHSVINSLHVSGELLCVTTTDEGVYFIVNNIGWQLTKEEGLTDNFIYDAFITPDEIIVTTDRGINHIRLKDGKPYVEVFTTAQGLPDNIVRILKPIPTTKLCWIGTQEGGLAIYDDYDETIHQMKMGHTWAWGQVNDVLPITINEAWVATEEGYLLNVKRFEDSIDVTPYSFDGYKFKKLLKDKVGNIWCATNKGIIMNTALFATQVRIAQQYHLNEITALAIDRQNNLWYTQHEKLYRLLSAKAYNSQLVLSMPADITSLYFDSENTLWLGTFGKGVFSYRNNTLIPVKNISTLNNGHILSISAIKDHLWIASLNGVDETSIEHSSKKLTMYKHHNKASGIGSDYIYQLYPDRKGRMWMATDGGGVSMYDGNVYHRWDSTNGLTSTVVYSITEDVSGNIWAGTLEKGVFVLEGEKWKHITPEHGIQNLNITAIQANDSGHVLVVNEDGFDQWYPADQQFRHYNRRLRIDIDSTSSVLNAIAKDTVGNVWIPFEHGFILFKNQGAIYNIKPSIRINRVSLFLKPLQQEQNLFSYDENHISFKYDGINYSNPERLNYRYKLEGFDDNWIYTSDEVITFPQLPSGRYRFRVQASLSNFFYKAAQDEYDFTIGKPFWRRAWFIICNAIVLLASGYFFVRIRERGLRKVARLQKERMIFEYEHLKSQVNPHFLFNSLNTLVNLIEDDQNEAVNYTTNLSDLYRSMLAFKDQDLIFLSEECKIITNYMHIQKSRFGEALQLHTSIPKEILKTKKIVPLALQLLVENAIKHNVVSVSRPLTIYIEANEAEITVRNTIQFKMSKEKGEGLGLYNIKKRYALLTNRITKFGIEDNQYIVTLPLL